MRLVLEKPLALDIVSHAADAFPAECCGALLSSDSGAAEDGGVRPSRYVRLRNVHEDARRGFRADPLEWVPLVAGLSARRERLVAVVHSHPAAPAALSESDAATLWRNVPFHLVVSLAGPNAAELRAWRWDTRRALFREADVEISEQATAELQIQVAERRHASPKRFPQQSDP